jgi:lysophospholipid acyltransferase (LPLAT)-like uncharacterized protein
MSDRESAAQGDAATRWIGRSVSALLRCLYRSWRVRFEGFEPVDAEVAAGRPVILITWHGRILTCIAHYGPRYRPHAMISQSRDGDRISAVGAPLGVIPVRGSSSRGGARALLEAVRLLEKGRALGHVVDGPRGPAGEIKPGLMLMAQRSGAAITPMYAASRHHWTATRSWDRMQLPLPWTRVLYRLGPLRHVSPELDEAGLEAERRALEAELREGYAQIDADVRSGS